ncbi:hypothetical protein ACFLQM_02255 [Acidobacteriota bacterium]
MNQTRSATVRATTAGRIVVPLLLLLGLGGCQSTAPETVPVDPEAAIERLNRPLSGDPAALYRLRISSSGGLRMSVLTSGEDGRLTVSEPFGAAVSLTSWSGSQPPTFFDLREGCQIQAMDLEQALGVAAMPLPQAVRLFVGRLPATSDDWIVPREDGRILVEGERWAAMVTVAADPWRVMLVEEITARDRGWRFELRDHTLSVPSFVRVENSDGRWAELELVRLEWSAGGELPPIPDLPLCSAETE